MISHRTVSILALIVLLVALMAQSVAAEAPQDYPVTFCVTTVVVDENDHQLSASESCTETTWSTMPNLGVTYCIVGENEDGTVGYAECHVTVKVIAQSAPAPAPEDIGCGAIVMSADQANEVANGVFTLVTTPDGVTTKYWAIHYGDHHELFEIYVDQTGREQMLCGMDGYINFDANGHVSHAQIKGVDYAHVDFYDLPK